MPLTICDYTKIKLEITEMGDLPIIKQEAAEMGELQIINQEYQDKSEEVDENFIENQEESVDYYLMLPENEVTISSARERDSTRKPSKSLNDSKRSEIIVKKARDKPKITVTIFKQKVYGLKCKICQKSFTRNDNLNQHMKYVHQNWKKSELFTCDGCGTENL
ncbi:hypothetical protein ACKWTF_007158 [Chironomus riparius]